ncbi:MAG: hypothetical protein JWM11_5104 [Planctomycetaceae bacterium]|nr:hypothetical protein [Planctomycetaceae bacterium]
MARDLVARLASLASCGRFLTMGRSCVIRVRRDLMWFRCVARCRLYQPRKTVETESIAGNSGIPAFHVETPLRTDRCIAPSRKRLCRFHLQESGETQLSLLTALCNAGSRRESQNLTLVYCNVRDQYGNESVIGNSASSIKNSESRLTMISISFFPFSAVAKCGFPAPVFVVKRCQGRVIETQPWFTAWI